MVSATLFVIASLALIVWRFALTDLRRGPLARGIAERQQRRQNLLEQNPCILDVPSAAVIAGNRFEDSSDSLEPSDRRDRAQAYLRHIVVLTDATQMGDEYVLDVGTARFHVRGRYVRRLRDAADPKCGYEETCFYPVHKGMPKTEEIATALLHLANNPALFDKWAAQNGQAFKADGQRFSGSADPS